MNERARVRRTERPWTATDGPAVEPPAEDGFGTAFVRPSVRYELNGTARFDFAPTGQKCAISFPFRHTVEAT